MGGKQPENQDGKPVELTPEQINALQAELKELKAHSGLLSAEAEVAKKKAADLEAAQQEAENQRLKESEQFKELYEKTVKDLELERENANKFKKTIQQKELESISERLASSLTKDEGRKKLLTKEVMQYAVTGEDSKVKFEIGGVPVEKSVLIEKIKADYPFLVDGSGMSGGGAAGSSGTGASGMFAGDFGGNKEARKNAIKNKFKLEV